MHTNKLPITKKPQKLIILLSIVAFGPYIIPRAGLRLEHFFIYSIFLYTFFAFLSGKTGFRLNRYALILIGLFGITVIWISAVSLLQNGFGDVYGLFAAVENFTQPIALIFILAWFLKGIDRQAMYYLFWIATITIIVMLCLNTLIAIATFFFDTWPFLKYFVLSDGGRGSVLERAVSSGRFTGIINQPFAAGLAYSIALLCWVYLASTTKRICFYGWIALTLLLAGGALSVSKAFIMAGFPLGVFLWLWINMDKPTIRKSTITRGLTWLLGGVALLIFVGSQWQGANRFLQLFDFERYTDRGIIRTLTAGRFGQGTTGVEANYLKVWTESPLFGLGAPPQGALDGAYLEFFYYGGSIGLLFNILMLLVIGVVGYIALRNSPKIGKFLVILWIFILGAGLGAPVLTINRSSIFLWIILVLAFYLVSKKEGCGMERGNMFRGTSVILRGGKSAPESV